MAKDGSSRSGTRGNRSKSGQQMNRPTMPDLSVVKVGTKTSEPETNDDCVIAECCADAAQICAGVSEWIRQQGCTSIQPRLVEEYAVAVARWRQVEKRIETEGFIAPHPTTGADCQSPLIGIANTYFKQMHAAWYAIWDVVRQSSAPADDLDEMESLLSGKTG